MFVTLKSVAVDVVSTSSLHDDNDTTPTTTTPTMRKINFHKNVQNEFLHLAVLRFGWKNSENVSNVSLCKFNEFRRRFAGAYKKAIFEFDWMQQATAKENTAGAIMGTTEVPFYGGQSYVRSMIVNHRTLASYNTQSYSHTTL